jgi:hypothetical protein
VNWLYFSPVCDGWYWLLELMKTTSWRPGGACSYFEGWRDR